MKIGIVTLHEADSYGAVLQAYALQHMLGSLGAESAFVSFEREKIGEGPSTNPVIQRIQQAGKRRNKRFADFRQQHLTCATAVRKDKAEACNAEYDRFLAGSDQVWNLQIPGLDGAGYLPFAEKEKRYSYAASFGSDTLQDKGREWCSNQLKLFQELSVREESGRTLIRRLTQRDACVSLDPVMLLDPADWNGLLHPIEGKPYVLLFLLQEHLQLFRAAKEEAQKRNVQVKIVTASFQPQFGVEAWCGSGVEDWISLIHDAQGVFTDSYHAALFTLLFRRPLYTAPLTGELRGRGVRLRELMELAGISFERLSNPDDFNERIAEKKHYSLDYLTKIITP